MLEIGEIPLGFPTGKRVHPSMGSIFHGALMELLAPEQAAFFHEQGMRPYSQAVFWDDARKQAVWRLGALDAMTAAIIFPVLEKMESITLRQQGYAVSLGKVRRQSFSAGDAGTMQEETPMGAVIHFLTTTSFKRNGVHVLFPEPELLYQSVLQRWPLISGMPMEPGIHQILSYYTIIQDYDLHTGSFRLEGHYIKGFSGTLCLCFGGGRQVQQLAGMLLQCGNAAGFGVKTALGMGASQVQIQYNKRVHTQRRKG